MEEPASTSSGVEKIKAQIERKIQTFLDRTVPFILPRWLFTGTIYLIYWLRVWMLQGFHIITYALHIYYLNLFIAFLTPKVDPVTYDDADDDDDDVGSLPSNNKAEFKPFIRRLPEFKFWWWATRATSFAFFCTFFELFNVPVFWPILVMYFIMLFVITMKRQLRHMIKHKYVPWTAGKKKFQGKDDKGDVIDQRSAFQ
jgi:hypothetical protein